MSFFHSSSGPLTAAQVKLRMAAGLTASTVPRVNSGGTTMEDSALTDNGSTVTATAATASTSATTGALVVTGGLGVGSESYFGAPVRSVGATSALGYKLHNTSSAANEGKWTVGCSASAFGIYADNDAETVSIAALSIQRSGGSNTSVTVGAKAILGGTIPLNTPEASAEPSSPSADDIYLDDGTNTASGSPGWRRYTGAAWEDIGGGAGAYDLNGAVLTLDADTDTTITADTDDQIDFAVGGSDVMKLTATALEIDTISDFSGGDITFERGASFDVAFTANAVEAYRKINTVNSNVNFTFSMNNSVGTQTNYGSITGRIVDNTSTSEDGQVQVYVETAGTSTEHAAFRDYSCLLAQYGATSTSRTNHFVYIPECAGTPTGTPASYNGIPLVYDSTNHILYAYSGGSWRGH